MTTFSAPILVTRKRSASRSWVDLRDPGRWWIRVRLVRRPDGPLAPEQHYGPVDTAMPAGSGINPLRRQVSGGERALTTHPPRGPKAQRAGRIVYPCVCMHRA